jgi:hypothetical protein
VDGPVKEAARQLVRSYVTEYEDDLERVRETERPFELHLPTAIISGREAAAALCAGT